MSDSDNRGRSQGVYQSSMNFAVLGAGIWGGALWSDGSQQPVLIFAAVGAACGALFFAGKYLLENLADRR